VPGHTEPVLARAASGDAAAVEACLARFSGLVWSLARRFCRNAADAEDAVQDVLVELWRCAGRYDAAVASEATFVAMIARRRLIDRHRRRQRQPDLQPLPELAPLQAEGVHTRIEQQPDVKRATQALLTLRPERQRVLRLSVYGGLSHAEIAEATGLPLGTVKTHVRRGLIQLRESLGLAAAAGTA
jgi:RNA polymerase sigma-70 factor (ECF subfamily)